MYCIVSKKALNPSVVKMEIHAPLVAAKAKAGQFIILRSHTDGERIPLTIAGYDREKGTVDIIFQIVGAATKRLSELSEGDFVSDFLGPLGNPTHTDGIKNVCVIGGGVGCAIALPVAKEFHALGARVCSIVGFRSRELVILEDEFSACSDSLTVMTDDGSYGRKGNVTEPLSQMLSAGERFDMIIAIGPLVMMKYTVETARPFNIPVTVSMNTIMIDGTGMCGGCRLTLVREGKRVMKFACVDGPDFNGYEVDFDEAMSRNTSFSEFERHAYGANCNLMKKAEE